MSAPTGGRRSLTPAVVASFARLALWLTATAGALAGCCNVPAAPPADALQLRTSGRPPLELRWAADPARAAEASVEVVGLPPSILGELNRATPSPGDWQRMLAVHTQPDGGDGTADATSMPPMLGAYQLDADVLRFRPQFALEPGVTYRAVLRPDRLPAGAATGAFAAAPPVTADYTPPAARSDPTTVVSHVYPTADVLPENLLKYYVHFSAPMSRGGIYEHVRLLDAAGRAVELPFLELEEELWDPPMTRLTLIIDPGRIKRGVRPLEEVGPALEEGKSFTLVVAATARDAAGNPLAGEYRKPFRVGPPDREPIDPAKWAITPPPRAGTRDPLTIAFGKPLDHALATRVIQVADAGGRAVEGVTSTDDGERRWVFTPAGPWAGGRYEVVVQRTLEDLAGNNIGKPFEVDLADQPADRKPSDSTAVRLPFDVP